MFGVGFGDVSPYVRMYVCMFLVRSTLLRGHLLGKNCPLGLPYVLFVSCLFVILVISRFGFEGWIFTALQGTHFYSFILRINNLILGKR